MSELTEQVVTAARSCLGTPFVHQGRHVGVALDCAGVVVHVMRSLGLPYNDEHGYPRHPYKGMMERSLDAQPHIVLVSRNAMQSGDVLLMRFRREPQHLAILAEQTIIHAYSGTGRVVEQTLVPLWRRRITHVYRIVHER